MVEAGKVDSQTPMSPEIEKKKNKRDSIHFWNKWIPAAKRAARRQWNDAQRAWREYDAGDPTGLRGSDGNRDWDGTGGSQWAGARYPLYWSCIKVVESAYYSRTPETFASRAFDIEDPDALTQALICDRLGRYGIKVGEYDVAMRESIPDYINADKTTTQICYEYYEVPADKPTRRAAMPGAMPDEYLDVETQQPVTDEIFVDPNDPKAYYYEVLDRVVKKRIYAKSVPYRHILHTPQAKNSCEIQDMAYYFCITRDEANDQYGKDVVDEWPDTVWKHSRTMDKDGREIDNRSEEISSPDRIVEGWEIWSKVTKKVYVVSPDLMSDFLSVKDDPFHLKGFFPSPKFVIGTKPLFHMYPTPAFVRLWPTLDMLHGMYGRVFNLIDACRRRALVDGNDDLVTLLTNCGDSEFIAVQNLKSLVEKGGLDTLVMYLPVKELVDSIAELNAQDEKFKNNVFEWFGVPDILRGSTDPIETATAQEQKVSAAHDRFRNAKKDIEELARETLEIMIDLYLYLYDDEEIAAIVGYKYMNPDDQARFPEALSALRNDEERIIRIEIETDSTSYIGEQIRMAQRTAVVQTVTKGLAEIQPMMEMSPQMAAEGIKVLMFSLEGIPGGRQFMDGTKKALEGMIEKMDKPPPPAPPDPAMIKAQVEQMKAETDRITKQAEQMRLDFETQLKQQKQEFDQWIQSNYFGLDTQKTEIEAENKGADNERLGVEAQAKVIEAMKPNAPEAKQESPTTVIINQQPSPVPEVPDILAELLK